MVASLLDNQQLKITMCMVASCLAEMIHMGENANIAKKPFLVEQKPYKCGHFDKRFAEKTKCNRHKLFHTGEQP